MIIYFDLKIFIKIHKPPATLVNSLISPRRQFLEHLVEIVDCDVTDEPRHQLGVEVDAGAQFAGQQEVGQDHVSEKLHATVVQYDVYYYFLKFYIKNLDFVLLTIKLNL